MTPIHRKEGLELLADLISETAKEADDWARNNQGVSAQEIFIAQVAVSGTLKLLESKIRSALNKEGSRK